MNMSDCLPLFEFDKSVDDHLERNHRSRGYTFEHQRL